MRCSLRGILWDPAERRTCGWRKWNRRPLAGKVAWLITLSMVNTEGSLGPINAAASSFGASAKREYKVFTVAKDNGDVTAMKIREFATT